MAITILGETTWRDEHKRFGIKQEDRRAHMLMLGKTGVGKSTLMANMVLSDIYAGRGVAVLDPHGALIDEIILNRIPDHRFEDMIYLNPLDREQPVPFNPLEKVDPQYHFLVVSGILSIMKKMWFDSWGNRLEHILRYALLSLMQYPESTLLDVSRLLLKKSFRQQVISKLSDAHLIAFWRDEFESYAGPFRNEMQAPVLNKVGQFPANPLLRNMVDQPKNTFDIREAMDSGKIVLVNLARGLIGEDASSLLGSMMITKIWLATLGRQDIPENDRRDFFLYIDEAHSITGSFANMLAETRKYRVSTTLALQMLGQLNPAFQTALLGNVGSIVSFRVGAEDASYLAREFYPTFDEADFVNLPTYHMYLKLLIDGEPSRGFSAVTLPLAYDETRNREAVITHSREQFGRPILAASSPTTTSGAWLP